MELQQDPAQEKYTFIINYPIMTAGGIETGLAALMRQSMKSGHRVIWITTKQHVNNVAFNGLLNNPKLEIVFTKAHHYFFGNPQISLSKDERVIMFTFEPLKYIVAEGIKRKAPCKNFMHYYVVSHFTGDHYYPDRFMKSSFGRQLVYRFWQKILRRLADNRCILGFAPKHLEGYEEHYQIPISDKEQRLFPRLKKEQYYFDENNTVCRCMERNDRFMITTCARLEFPHKAYILGLLDSFHTIKTKYPQAALQIIGYGDGEQELKDRIMKLPENIRKDVHFLGMVSPDVLKQYYKDSNLVVGLAGSIWTAGECGIPSLVTRHYCYDCETYGFLEDVPDKPLCEEKGLDIVPFIEECITMEPEQYLQHAKKVYETVTAEQDSLENFLEKYVPNSPCTVKGLGEILMGRVLYVINSIIRKLEGRNM